MGLFGMAFSYLAFSVLHFFQFVLAVTVCGLYGVDLHRAREQGGPIDGAWVRNLPAIGFSPYIPSIIVSCLPVQRLGLDVRC